jgi:hypothetical protein
MEFMFSEKGTKLLIIDNYKFGFQKNLADNIQRWICTKRKCKAYVKYSGDCLCEYSNTRIIPITESKNFKSYDTNNIITN